MNLENTSKLPTQRRALTGRYSPSRDVFARALIVAGLMLAPAVGHALPSFARQIDQNCTACHTAFPILNAFGRQFKLSGYTASAEKTNFPPFAVMLMPSFTHTQKGQDGGAAPGFGDNNNWAVTQASIFYGGRLFGPYADSIFGKDAGAFFNKIGIFTQTTYDGVGKAWSWDNTEVRYADTASIKDQDVIWGIYANNNPTLQDPWNSTPAWGYPFTGSGLAPGPSAGPLIDGGLAQQVACLGTYAFISNSVYIDVAGYHTLGQHIQSSLGVDPSGETQVPGIAPYWRVAIEKMMGDARWEFGTFGLSADTYPGRDSSAGKDHYLDLGFDTQYQLSIDSNDLIAMASWIYERESWDASSVLGNSANARDTLHELKLTVGDLYDKTFGFTAQYFNIGGSDDDVLNAGPNGSPASDGLILQADYMPFNKNGGPSFWPRSNVKLSLQYTMYNQLDGDKANAKDANTLYAEAWIAF